MAIHKNSAAYKIRAYLKLHPKAPATEVAEKLGVSTHAVHSTKWRDKKLGAPKRKYTKRPEMFVLNPQQVMAMQKIPEGKWTPIAVTTSNTPFDPALPITMEEPKVDVVNHPPHYKVGGIEVIDFIQAKLTPEEFRGYLKGNVLKYTSRAGHKDDAGQDIGKLVWYATKLQETHTT
jgi:hypothetical protein